MAIERVAIIRGEVHLVQLDPTRGSEIRKTRPCLIVSPDELNHHLRSSEQKRLPVNFLRPLANVPDQNIETTKEDSRYIFFDACSRVSSPRVQTHKPDRPQRPAR